MEPACITNMDIVSLEMVAKEHTTKKVVVILLSARGQDFGTKDSQKSVKKYNTDRGCKYGSDCANQYSRESIKASYNDFKKEVELLETLVIEMGNKMINLETEIKDIKSSKNNMITNRTSVYTVKKYEEIKDENKGENKPDQGVKEPIVSENRKEHMMETRETPKLVKSCFKCDVCGASFKKEAHQYKA